MFYTEEVTLPNRKIVIDIEQEPGQIPAMKIDAGDMTGPDLLFHLRNVCDIIQTQVISATVKAQLAVELGIAKPKPGGIVIPGLVPPRDLRG